MGRNTDKKRVLVVGAGAAGTKYSSVSSAVIEAGHVGMSCAELLSQHPEKFDVTLLEAQAYCGGQAFSIPIDKEKYGASWLNQGVQGWVLSYIICLP
jgi:predicted NAD/FAD-binding protein